MGAVRTTVTLEPDVAAELKRVARDRGVSFKRVINDAIRSGLRSSVEPHAYTMPTFELGLRPDIDLDRALALAAALEDDEVVRKLTLRK